MALKVQFLNCSNGNWSLISGKYLFFLTSCYKLAKCHVFQWAVVNTEEILDVPEHWHLNTCRQIRGKKNSTLTNLIRVYSRPATFNPVQCLSCFGRSWHFAIVFSWPAVYISLGTPKSKVKQTTCWKHPALWLFKTASIRMGVQYAI